MTSDNPVCRLGFLVSSLGASQLAYHLLSEANEYLKTTLDIDVIVFYQNVGKVSRTPTFGMMNISECYGFTGAAIATDLSTAERLMMMPGPTPRLFYVWDLEWVQAYRQGDVADHERMAAAYCHPGLQLIARSRSHAEAIERAWNRPVLAVVENCRLAELASVVRYPHRVTNYNAEHR